MATKGTPIPENHTPKIPQQLERIKKQEEDENWISGEELCTEGSSDDECTEKAIPAITPKCKKTKRVAQMRSTQQRRPSPLSYGSSSSYKVPVSRMQDRPGVYGTTQVDAHKEMENLLQNENLSYTEITNFMNSIKIKLDRINSRANPNESDLADTKKFSNLTKLKNKMFMMDNEIFEMERTKKIVKMSGIKDYIKVLIQEEFQLRVEYEINVCQSLSFLDRFGKFFKSDELFLKLCEADQKKYKKLQGRKGEVSKLNEEKSKCKSKISSVTKKLKNSKISFTIPKLRSFNFKKLQSKNSCHLTREQKRKLELLLKDLDLESDDDDNADSCQKCENERNVYHFSADLEEKLRTIDEKLKSFSISPTQSTLLTEMLENKPKSKVNSGPKLNSAKLKLKRIDNDLQAYHKKYRENEIIPLSNEEMNALLQECKRNFDENRINGTPSEQDLQSVVQEAQADIPKFKYKYENETSEEEPGNDTIQLERGEVLIEKNTGIDSFSDISTPRILNSF